MEPDNRPQQAKTAYNPGKRQDGDKTKSVRFRSGEGTLAYWREKLFRNNYRDRKGNKVEMPEYYVRLRHEGLTKRVRLHSSDKDKAAEEALRLSEGLRKDGWGLVTSGQARLPASPSIEEFCAAYVKAAARMETPPRKVSIDLYLRHLRRICALAGVTRLRELTPEAAERARDEYRELGREQKRTDSGIQNSISIILRNAAACFSREARDILARQGLSVENPFSRIKRSQKIDPVTALGRDVVNRIWNELPLLRDGDPKARQPDVAKFIRNYKKLHEGRRTGRLPIDFRVPHPDAYCAILLGLGLGLRANEIDKARWSWVRTDARGDYLLEVREEPDFKPKGGTLRVIRIPDDLYEELTKAQFDFESPYILGGLPSRSVEKNGWGYRCRETLRVVNTWLRERGVETNELRGNPLHRMRKQFGSEVATDFGLFAAQKYLGHSSPTTTSRYYAAQTELPALTHVRITG